MTDSLKNKLIGGWHLKVWKISYSDGRQDSYPYGPDAQGILVYTADGYMSANISRANRPRLGANSLRQAPAEEKIAAFESNFSYAGPYRVQGQQVIHTVEHALNPNMPGSEQVRDISFDGPDLVLQAEEVLDHTDLRRYHRLTWTRRDAINKD